MKSLSESAGGVVPLLLARRDSATRIGYVACSSLAPSSARTITTTTITTTTTWLTWI